MTSAEMVVVGMKHIVCFSGGHSSAIAAVEVVRKFGAEDTILLNHDLCPRTEDADIKRFKKQVSDYLGVPITYANMPGWDVKPPSPYPYGDPLCYFSVVASWRTCC